ncbi:MAG: cytoplasmic protein [Thermodesulfobacteriota bacterium]|nr:cytoplasmic protein [Thermodesulfobacteriota bacterium]
MQKPYYTHTRQPASTGAAPAQNGVFKEFDATELYCPKCNRSMPVRKRLLLVLPEGEKYEYLCARCATSVGTKIVRGGEQIRLVI